MANVWLVMGVPVVIMCVLCFLYGLPWYMYIMLSIIGAFVSTAMSGLMPICT